MKALVGERRAIAAAVFSFYGFIYLLMAFMAPPEVGPMMMAMASLYGVAFFGAPPLGALAEGAIAHSAGAAATIFGGGAVCLVAGLAFHRALPALRLHARPATVKLGILPGP